MNWQIALTVILEIVRRLLERKLNPSFQAGPGGAANAAAFADDAQADRWATQLEQAGAAPAQGAAAGTAGHDGGVISHVRELVEALRAKDWARIQSIVLDMIGHL